MNDEVKNLIAFLRQTDESVPNEAADLLERIESDNAALLHIIEAGRTFTLPDTKPLTSKYVVGYDTGYRDGVEAVQALLEGER